MKQRIVMFEPADMDRVAIELERLLALDPSLDSGDKESFRSIIGNMRQQLGSPKTDRPLMNEVITAWTVEDVVDAARETEANGKGRLTGAEINAVAEKLRRNPGDMCWDDIYHEIGRCLSEKGKPQKKKPRAPINSGRKTSLGDFLVWAMTGYNLWHMENIARNDLDNGWQFKWNGLPGGISDTDILKSIPSRKFKN